MTTQMILLIAFALIAVWAIWTYNRLVRARRVVDEAWSGVDVQLKRRHDLIPNLVETVKGYAQHEKGTLEELVALRGKAVGAPSVPSEAAARAEDAIGNMLQRVLVLAESYPALRASGNFVALQNSLESIENDLQMARRYYNGAVRDYSVLRESVPSNIIAGIFSFAPKPFFELSSKKEAELFKVTFEK